MTLALAFLVLLYVGIAAGIYGLYRLVPSWWPYWLVLVVALETGQSLHEPLERLAELADVPRPRLLVARTSAPNAFTIGLSPRRTVIVVSTGLLERLNAREREAPLRAAHGPSSAREAARAPRRDRPRAGTSTLSQASQ